VRERERERETERERERERENLLELVNLPGLNHCSSLLCVEAILVISRPIENTLYL
jgi:hypothetical protein